jgi:energy-coupling factor transporter ATP-binding protein EcfA2
MKTPAQMQLRNIGPITEAEIRFGDMTIFTGPQASGKSIALQTFKLLLDTGYIHDILNRYGMDWSNDRDAFLDIYFGEGMHSLWQRSSELHYEGEKKDIDDLATRKKRNKREKLFYIPAQRVLALREGWPRYFTDFSSTDPFVVRDFSEKLRILIDQELIGGKTLFPQKRRLKEDLRQLLQKTVYTGFQIVIDRIHGQKRLILTTGMKSKAALPFMVWSAGQREFTPLLLGLYWLMPPSKISRRGDIRWVVIEEPEMGLHPHAIEVVMLLLLELLSRGYRVCLSTHCPQILEFVWAIQHLQKNDIDCYEDLFQLFGLTKKTKSLCDIFQQVIRKDYRIYYFDTPISDRKEKVKRKVCDISDLDASMQNDGDATWGGLLALSERANRIVARASLSLHDRSISSEVETGFQENATSFTP